MQIENVLYALSQLIHNFAAVAVTSIPIVAILFSLSGRQLRLAYLIIMVAWVLQVATGASFGLISYFVVGSLPELHYIALAALGAKITCAIVAVVVLFAKRLGFIASLADRLLLTILSALGVVALSSAAILRWFS